MKKINPGTVREKRRWNGRKDQINNITKSSKLSIKCNNNDISDFKDSKKFISFILFSGGYWRIPKCKTNRPPPKKKGRKEIQETEIQYRRKV